MLATDKALPRFLIGWGCFFCPEWILRGAGMRCCFCAHTPLFFYCSMSENRKWKRSFSTTQGWVRQSISFQQIHISQLLDYSSKRGSSIIVLVVLYFDKWVEMFILLWMNDFVYSSNEMSFLYFNKLTILGASKVLIVVRNPETIGRERK